MVEGIDAEKIRVEIGECAAQMLAVGYRTVQHFYVFAFAGIIALSVGSALLSESIQLYAYLFIGLAAASILLSLIVSYYIYDMSGLYDLKWIEQSGTEKLILNINAGFDETSHLLKEKFKTTELIALDF